jgi:muramoyltetrapeptide carboxypeptidase
MKPFRLSPGAIIGVVAPSSKQSIDRIEQGLKTLHDLGYQVVLSQSVVSEDFIKLSGSDQIRAADINELFLDDQIDAIICSSGGYGSPRIVDQLDYNMISTHPKPFVGFSDITLFLNAIHQQTGQITYHGPMIVGDFSRGSDIPHITSFFDVVNGRGYTIDGNNHPMTTIVPGESKGTLVGGNLSLLQVLAGSKYCFDPKGKILLIEEVHEANYRIDRMLQTLRLKGLFDGLHGVIIGGITGEQTPQEGSLELFERFFQEAPFPVLFNAPIGHVIPRYTVPIGGTVHLDASNQTITILGHK